MRAKMKSLGVPAEAVGMPVVVDNKNLRERVCMAEEWRAARDRQAAADDTASQRVELDALASALVDEVRRAPMERLSGDGVTVLRPYHVVYESCVGLRWHTRDDLRNELNARLEAAAHGVRVTRVTVSARRGLLHRVCQCGGDFDDGTDECPMECCCCLLWGAMCACLPLLYWLPRMCRDHSELIARWEIRVNVRAHA